VRRGPGEIVGVVRSVPGFAVVATQVGLSLFLGAGCATDDRMLKASTADSGVDRSAGILSGCTVANTQAAPSNGSIAAFLDESNLYNSGSPNGNELIYTATGGKLNLTENHGAEQDTQYDDLIFDFVECVDATSFAGVEFTLSGSVSGCTMQYSTNFTEDTRNDGTANSDPKGSCQPSLSSICYSPQIEITATTTATTIQAPWVNPSFYLLGNPVPSPNDPARLTSVQWQFTIPARATCLADVTISNLGFYH
jgi:hypothetical protein